MVNAFQDPAYVADQNRKRLSISGPTTSRSNSVVTPPPGSGGEATRTAIRTLIAQERAARERYFSSLGPIIEVPKDNVTGNGSNGSQV